MISGGERVGTRVGRKAGKEKSVDICMCHFLPCIGRIISYTCWRPGGGLLLVLTLFG